MDKEPEREGEPDIDGMEQDRLEEYKENAYRAQMKAKSEVMGEMEMKIDQELYQTIQAIQLVREQMQTLFDLSKKE